MTEQTWQPRVLYESRAPHLWQPGCAAIGTLMGLAALVTGQLGGLVLLVPFGAFLVLSTFWYRARADRLTLDADGFTIAHGAFDRRVLWRQIASIEMVEGRGRWIHLRLQDADQSYPWRKTMPGSSRSTAPTIPASYDGLTTDQLADTLRQWHAHGLAREPVAGAAVQPQPSIGPYVVRPDEGAGVELVRAGPGWSCLTLFYGFWIVCWDAITIGMTFGLARADPGSIVMLLIIWAVAIGGTYFALRAVLERRSWLLRGGVVTERIVVRGIGEISRRTYEPIERVEIRSGVWDTGAGSTDDLVVWVSGRAEPLVIEPKVDGEGPRIRALGELVARHVARPLVATETSVPEPPPPGD